MGREAEPCAWRGGRARLARAGLVILVVGAARPALAIEGISFVAGGGVLVDSNPFRLPEVTKPPSDTIRIGYVGVRINKTYSLQNFTLDVTQSAYRHVRFTALDFSPRDYKSAFNWQVGQRLTGTLSADHTTSIVSFADFRSLQRNLRDTDNRVASFDYATRGKLHFLSELAEKTQKTEVVVASQPDFHLRSLSAGLKYESSSGTTASTTRYQRRGEYLGNVPVQVDTRFEETESEVKLNWHATGRATLDGRLGYLERHHEHLPQRDFSGPVGSLALDLETSGKLKGTASFKRELNPSLDPFSVVIVRKTLALKPTWQHSEKVAFKLELEGNSIDFRSPPVTPPGPPRHDLVRSTKLLVEWTATRTLSISVSAQGVSRASSDAAFGFDANIVQITAELTL